MVNAGRQLVIPTTYSCFTSPNPTVSQSGGLLFRELSFAAALYHAQTTNSHNIRNLRRSFLPCPAVQIFLSLLLFGSSPDVCQQWRVVAAAASASSSFVL